MTHLDLTTHPIEPSDTFTLNDYDDPHTLLALVRIDDTAAEAYTTARHEASHHAGLDDEDAHTIALETAVRASGRLYAAAALERLLHALGTDLPEDIAARIGDTAAAIDLGVVEDLTGANDEPTGDDTAPEVSVFHRRGGWTLSGRQTPEPCTSNYHRQQGGRPACTSAAVWKVVENHGMHLTIGFWCDNDLPAEHRHL